MIETSMRSRLYALHTQVITHQSTYNLQTYNFVTFINKWLRYVQCTTTSCVLIPMESLSFILFLYSNNAHTFHFIIFVLFCPEILFWLCFCFTRIKLHFTVDRKHIIKLINWIGPFCEVQSPSKFWAHINTIHAIKMFNSLNYCHPTQTLDSWSHI